MPTFLLEEDHNLPLCKIQITVRTGAATDDPALGRPLGLCYFTTELMRRGAGGKSRAILDESLDRMGASLSVLCSHDAVTFDLLTLKEKLHQVLPILSDVLLRPNFDLNEAASLKRETIAHLDELRDDDSGLASRFFARALFHPHPYENPVEGTSSSIPNIGLEEAQLWHQGQIVSKNLIFGSAGDITASELQDIFQQYFAKLPSGKPSILSEPNSVTPSLDRHRLLLVDKPGRTQSQILVGQMAPKWTDPSWLPLHIATTAFGGTFTARLMDEVRVKRGLSYGASAYVGKGRDAQGLVMHVFPSAEQTVETLTLILDLYKTWALGLTPEEIEFAKGYLAKSYAFAIQTPEARLRRRTQLELCGMPQDEITTFPQRVKATSAEQINQTIRERLEPQHLLITLVASSDYMKPELEKMSSLRDIKKEIVPYDSY